LNRTERPQTDLRQALKGLNYEMDIMRRTAYALASGVVPRNSLQQISLLESFLLHVRNLLEFVVPQRNVSDETAISDDFFPSPDHWQGDSKNGRSRAQELFESELHQHQDWTDFDLHRFRWKLHTTLAHISYSNKDQTEWPFVLVLRGVEKALNHFMNRAAEHGADGVFQEVKE
jgi:hypothetical protein